MPDEDTFEYILGCLAVNMYARNASSLSVIKRFLIGQKTISSFELLKDFVCKSSALKYLDFSNGFVLHNRPQ